MINGAEVTSTACDVYGVGFKDVYPWVWSVMLGVAVTIAKGREAFKSTGTQSKRDFLTKNLSAILINVLLPALLFGLTLTRLGPKYPRNMDVGQILGALYLAGTPLGSQPIVAPHRKMAALATFGG
jgi:hypothetical protein